MKRNRHRVWMLILLAVVAVNWGTVTWASVGYTFSRSAAKASRGLSNLTTGWMEIPYRISMGSNRRDPAGSICEGALEGIGWGIVRTAVGLVEITTFWLPVPTHYNPILPTPDYYWRWRPLDDWRQTYENTWQ